VARNGAFNGRRRRESSIATAIRLYLRRRGIISIGAHSIYNGCKATEGETL
jgi:hypothetical protein